jgi:serine-type D-Ala-D-Ala carboxypeptidase/endopeptidase (penicillin-binding protein 4)
VRTVPRGGPTALEVGEVKEGRVVVKGTIPIGIKPSPLVQVIRLPEPAFLARSLFVEALERAGVKVDAPVVASNASSKLPRQSEVAAQPKVAALTSPPVSEFVKLIQKVSHTRARIRRPSGWG